MKKIRNTSNYIDTVKNNSDFFLKYYYHSLIDLNLVKLDLILKNGILSKKLIEQKNLVNLYTHPANDYDSKNGNMYVSLTEYKSDSSFSEMFESFALHTLSSTSILVNKKINIEKEGEKETFFDDEVFCLNSVNKENIEGIILPEHLTNLCIGEVNCLPNDLSCYTKSYINNWIYNMETYFKEKISSDDLKQIKISLEQLCDIFEHYESPEKWVGSAVESQQREYGMDIKDVLALILEKLWSKKLSIKEPKYIDVLMNINQQNLPIYEIKQKSLKRLN